jgi:hypothetical protein
LIDERAKEWVAASIAGTVEHRVSNGKGGATKAR